MLSTLQYCPARTSHRYRPSSTNFESRSRSVAFSQAKISSIFESTNTARRRLSFGATRGLPLFVKHVKPIKVARSRLTNEFGINQWFVAKTQPEVGTADAPVLRKTNPRPGRELGSFDLTNRCINQLAKLSTLLVGDRSQQILNLRDAFPHESHNGDVGDPSDPGVADQLEVKRCQTLRLLRITGAGGFPFEQTALAVQVANGIDIGHEIIAICERADQFLLCILLRLANADSVISGELLQQTDSLAKQALPVVSVGVLQRNIAVHTPLLEQHGSGILALEECRHGFLKTATEAQRCPRLLLPPTVQIPKPIAPRTAQVLRYLRVAKRHGQPPGYPPQKRRVLPIHWPGQTRQG